MNVSSRPRRHLQLATSICENNILIYFLAFLEVSPAEPPRRDFFFWCRLILRLICFIFRWFIHWLLMVLAARLEFVCPSTSIGHSPDSLTSTSGISASIELLSCPWSLAAISRSFTSSFFALTTRFSARTFLRLLDLRLLAIFLDPN